MNDNPIDTPVSPPERWYLNRQWRFLLFNSAFALAFFGPLRELALTSWRNEYYSYIPFIPVISAYLIREERRDIFTSQEYSLPLGLPLIVISGLLLYVVHARASFAENPDRLSIITLLLITFWIGGFALIYGAKALRAAAFPLLFLLFAVPIPNAGLEWSISLLQAASADLSYWFLQATGMPIARDGFIFHLPTLDIEVAPQCSGVRSSLSLIITGVLAAYFFLRTGWARTLLIVSLVPIAILKNGMRISALALLAVYWDEKILAGDFHHKGGVVFFILAMFVAGAFIMLLRKIETRKTAPEKK